MSSASNESSKDSENVAKQKATNYFKKHETFLTAFKILLIQQQHRDSSKGCLKLAQASIMMISDIS